MGEPVRFGRYLLERRLAMGGMAEVFLGRIDGPSGFQKRVVIKRILPHLQDDPNHVSMFLDEARLAARFDHPNLIQVYELAQISDQYCLAMEFIEGKDVAAILDESVQVARKIPVSIAAYIVSCAAEGLHYVHELTTDSGEPLNVVHRDVSPANIIVTWRGGVKIVDFGIAKHEVATSHTVAGTLKGKFSYMSPEQARGRKVDRRSDIFSLGAIFYELLTVSPCFAGKGQLDILDAVTNVDYRPLREMRPDAPPELDRILRRMLTLHREDRFSTAREVQMHLKQFMSRVGTPSASDLGSFLSELFGREPKSSEPGRVATAIHDLDEIPVTDELASPAVRADERSYEMILGAQNPGVEELDSELTDVDSGEVRQTAVLGQRRRSTLSRMADRLRQPKYWPTTLAVIAGAMLLSGFALVMLYRAALGQPWGPGEVLDELLWGAASSPTADEVVQVAALQVVTHPPGAVLTIDGQRMPGNTPLTVDNVPLLLPHRVSAELDGFETAVQNVTIRKPGLSVVTLKLRRQERKTAKARITVSTEPSGALVILDAEDTGKRTPATIELVPGISHTITARLEGYQAEPVTLSPGAGTDASVAVVLSELEPGADGLLEIDSEPDTEIIIGGRKVGSTPLKNFELPAGPVVVQLRNNKLGLAKTLRLDIPAGEKLRRNVVFRKGQIVLDVKPWASVYLGRRKLGTTPMPPLSLYEGTYALRLVNDELGVERVVQVSIRPGKLRKVVEELK